jgi:hypothetical protein
MSVILDGGQSFIETPMIRSQQTIESKGASTLSKLTVVWLMQKQLIEAGADGGGSYVFKSADQEKRSKN